MEKKLGEAVVPIRATLDKLDSDLAGARKKLDGALSGVGIGISTAVANKSIELLQDGVRLAVDTMADGVSMAADLESQLDAIGAISGATEEQVAGLKDTIMDLGIDPNLKVSAFEAAQAVEELAAGGVSLEDIMNGAARGTVALANATGGDFALAATVAADSMSIFGIKATELEHVVDGVAAVAVQSKFDVNDYALALAQAGGVAASSGVEFDDFNTAITGIAPLFASGSDAGTSFKTMLQRLIPQSNEASDAMREVGLFAGLTDKEFDKLQDKVSKVNEKIAALDPTSKNYAKKLEELTQKKQELTTQMVAGSNAFFDDQGNMKSMAEIAGLLQTAFGGLSEEQRNAALSTIFGTDAMRAAVGLMELGGQGFTDLQNKMAQTSGMDAAAERMTNLKGATEILSGTVETLQIQYGDRLIPKLTEMAQKATDFASTEGPALVDSLANLTLGAIDFGERATPGLSRGLEVITGLAASTNNLAGAAVDLGEAWGLASEKAENVDAVMLLLNAAVDAAMAPYNGLKSIVDLLTTTFSGWGQTVRDVKGWFSDLAGSMSSLDDSLPEWLRPGSPPPLAFALADINEQLQQMSDFSSRFDAGTPAFPALAGAGGGSHTTNIFIDGIQVGSGAGGSVDEALAEAFDILRQRIKGKK